ncbi:MAG: Crp/Fnr family transcriptional regulator [Gemmataceae bacterium]
MYPLSRTNSTGNHLLDLLPRADADCLLDRADVVALAHGDQLYRHDGAMAHVYFPVSGVCSVQVIMSDGKAVEASAVGREGMVGIYAALGLDVSTVAVAAQVPGRCYRLPTDTFARAVCPGQALDRVLRRYAAYAIRSVYQTVACNAVHSVEERACRWLLMTHDRIGSDEFPLTHEYLAEMLGVRRQTITGVALGLQEARLIAYRRGMTQIVDRAGLERASCECYRITRRVYDQMMR